jgi:hypothetical protein
MRRLPRRRRLPLWWMRWMWRMGMGRMWSRIWFGVGSMRRLLCIVGRLPLVLGLRAF